MAKCKTDEENKTEIETRIAQLARIKARLDLEEAPQTYALLLEDYEVGLNTGWGPLVGMPCTYNVGSDRYAGTVVYVSASGKKVIVDVSSRKETFTLRKNGKYRPARKDYAYLTFLKAETKLDPSF